MIPPEARDDLIKRLRKIEGQTQGIQRMLLEGRDCREVLNQLASVRGATQQVSAQLVTHYALSCLSDPACVQSEENLHQVIELILQTPA
jgi:DNA-binding FrmR family transcriptional regulator